MPVWYDDEIQCGQQSFKTDGNTIEEELKRLGPPETKLLAVFPIPTQSNLNIYYQLKQNDYATVSLANMLGQSVIDSHPLNEVNKTVLDVSNLPSGIYFFKFYVNNSPVETKKFIVK